MLLAFPIILPLTAAILSLFLWQQRYAQRALTLASALITLILALVMINTVQESGIQHLALGGWQPPFGIVLVADLFSAIMVTLSSLIGLAVTTFSLFNLDRQRVSFGYYPLVNTLLMGINGAFLTGDLFNLYVWFEVMLIGSFVLLTLGRGRPAIEGALKYVVLNLIGSSLFLAATGAVYALTRTLNLAELSARMPEIALHRPGLVLGLAGLYLVAFGLKAGLFPLFSWLPASYHTPPVAVSALFAGLLTKVGVYALLRVFSTAFAAADALFPVVLAIAGVTMIVGVLGAVAQFETRRILGFHIVSQIGYIVVGIGLLASDSPEVRRAGIAAAVFYTAHHILVKANLYLVAGVVRNLGGSERIARLGGLAVAAPWLAVLFLIPALSLAGIPPLSGFWAKLAVLRAAIDADAWWTVTAALTAGLLTLVSMMKIWTEAFWKSPPGEAGGDDPTAGTSWADLSRIRRAALVAPIVLLAALTVAIGLAPDVLFEYAGTAADHLLDPTSYVEAVRGGGGAR